MTTGVSCIHVIGKTKFVTPGLGIMPECASSLNCNSLVPRNNAEVEQRRHLEHDACRRVPRMPYMALIPEIRRWATVTVVHIGTGITH
jgi:hypothetical protein